MQKYNTKKKRTHYELLVSRINELCNEKDISYYRLSNNSAVPITTLMNIVDCATKNPGIFTVLKLCQGLGVSAKEFFDSEEFQNMEIEDGE